MRRPERFSGDACHIARTSSVNPERSTTPKRSAPRSCYDGQMVVRVSPVSRPKNAFNGVKVFAATMFRDRECLGERVTQWLAEHPELDIVDLKVTQSSDAAFHCITISVFYLEGGRPAG
jgi:hypothetical protein